MHQNTLACSSFTVKFLSVEPLDRRRSGERVFVRNCAIPLPHRPPQRPSTHAARSTRATQGRAYARGTWHLELVGGLVAVQPDLGLALLLVLLEDADLPEVLGDVLLGHAGREARHVHHVGLRLLEGQRVRVVRHGGAASGRGTRHPQPSVRAASGQCQPGPAPPRPGSGEASRGARRGAGGVGGPGGGGGAGEGGRGGCGGEGGGREWGGLLAAPAPGRGGPPGQAGPALRARSTSTLHSGPAARLVRGRPGGRAGQVGNGGSRPASYQYPAPPAGTTPDTHRHGGRPGRHRRARRGGTQL